MKRIHIMTIIAASMMAAAPTVATAQANPAAGLSVAKSDTSVNRDKRRGGILIAILAAAAVVAGIVIVADNDDNSDSN
jgi:hypothetical protein